MPRLAPLLTLLLLGGCYTGGPAPEETVIVEAPPARVRVDTWAAAPGPDGRPRIRVVATPTWWPPSALSVDAAAMAARDAVQPIADRRCGGRADPVMVAPQTGPVLVVAYFACGAPAG